MSVGCALQKTLEASRLNDAILKVFLGTGNAWVRKRVRDLHIRPAQRPVLPTSQPLLMFLKPLDGI